MKANKKHIGKEDFQRYLKNQMTDTERNAFERELQKHPFEAEALEGFQQISTADLEKDLSGLSLRINSGKNKNKTRYWAAAATFLMLITTSVIWFQLKERTLLPELAETQSMQKEEIKAPKAETQNQEYKKPGDNKPNTENLELIEEPASPKAAKPRIEASPVTEQKKKEESVQQKPDQLAVADRPNPEEKVTAESNVAAAPKQEIRIRGVSSVNERQKTVTARSSSQLLVGDTKIVWGKVISGGDSLPIPGATIVEKGTSNGTTSDRDGNFILKLTNAKDSVFVASFVGMEKKEFYPARDSSLVVALEPSSLALDEVVTVGYGVSKKMDTGERVLNARPKTNMSQFRKYMDKHAILPESYPDKSVVVKVAMHLNSKGEIVSIENKNNADSTIFERTKQIILKGPAWDAEILNGTPVESEVKLKIVFRKEK